MKKILVLVTIFMLCFAVTSMAQIAGSGHDFSASGWNTNGEICQPCHVPHGGENNTNTAYPLWSHVTTSSVFTVYADVNGSLDATLGQPSGVSKQCLGCHDGSEALDDFIGDTTAGTTMTGTYLLSTDLSNDHPISFTYNTALANTDPGLHDPAVKTTVQDFLFNSKVECASCHDPHNGAGVAGLLRIPNTDSDLCLMCHNK